jgi:transposase
LEQLRTIPDEQIVYVDETGIDACLYREYGWSERGAPLIGRISGHKYKRTGIVAAQMGKTILSPLQYDGTMDSILFETWFEICLLPALPEKSVIVMDNASFHRKRKLWGIIENTEHSLIFLPPYSPELNPIENFWSWLKRYLKKVIHLYDSFQQTLCSAFNVS